MLIKTGQKQVERMPKLPGFKRIGVIAKKKIEFKVGFTGVDSEAKAKLFFLTEIASNCKKLKYQVGTLIQRRASKLAA